ncbi:unnamed protein product [Mycena citricolor]|uniref:Zn(2)-C6 fungal-type domain-containing protein n=1 Tax=Mycena citricolor TaxID=2018698 RepID=A0AAD2HWZ9_9AGAR|nr:unnamed protein product [Mycena citricolor]
MNTTNARGGPSLPSIRSLHPYLPPAPSTAPAPSSLAPPVSRTPPPHAGPSAARDHDRDYDRDREHEEARGTLPPFSSYPVEESDGDGDERDSMPEPPKKKRRRQPLSCTECKRRKIKCDRSQPCGPCSRRGDQAKCRWHIVEPATDKYVPRSEFEALRARVDTLEDYIRRLPGPGPASSTFGGTAPTGFFPQAQMQSPDTIHPPAEMLMGIAAGPYPAPPGPSAHDPGLAYSPIQSRAPLPARVGYMPMPMPPPAGMPPHHLVLLDSSPFPSSPGYRPGHARSRSFGEGTRRPLSADGDASPPGLTVPHSAGPSASSFDLPLPSGPPPSSAAAPDSRVRSLSPRERARRGEHGALPPLMGLGPAPGPGPGPPPPSSSSSSSRHGDVGFHPYRAEGGRHRATSRAYDPAREAGSSSSSTSASRTAHTQLRTLLLPVPSGILV